MKSIKQLIYSAKQLVWKYYTKEKSIKSICFNLNKNNVLL